MVFFLIAEDGGRFVHMNFYWQIVISSWILFFYSLIDLLQQIKMNGVDKINKGLLIIYFFHVAAGLIYLLRAFILRTGY